MFLILFLRLLVFTFNVAFICVTDFVICLFLVWVLVVMLVVGLLDWLLLWFAYCWLVFCGLAVLRCDCLL